MLNAFNIEPRPLPALVLKSARLYRLLFTIERSSMCISPNHQLVPGRRLKIVVCPLKNADQLNKIRLPAELVNSRA